MGLPAASSSDVERSLSGDGGGRTIFIAQGLRVLIRIGSAALLARLLTPAAYGIFGMAGAAWGLLNMARDFGIITALQQPEITPQRRNALFRIGALGGVALAVLGAAIAVPTGWFFEERASVPAVLMAMSTAFVFSGLAAPALGILYRERKAGAVALMEAAAMGIASAAAIGAAWSGGGVWALVLLGVLTEALTCLFAWLACSWRPGNDTKSAGWIPLMALGASLTGHNLANYFTRSLDQIIVGRIHGAAALGLYGRGVQIATLPSQFGVAPFSSYMLATLGRLRRSPVEHVAFFRHGLNGLMHVAFLGATFCVAVPEILVGVLFGQQWLAAAPVVRWLGVALAMQPWLSAPLWLLGPEGAGRRLLAWSICGAAVMALGCTLAARSGFEAVAAVAATTAALQAALGAIFCAGRTAVSWSDWLRPAFVPAVVHGGATLSLFVFSQRVAPSSMIPRATLLFVIAFGYYAVAYLLWPRLRSEVRQHIFWSR